MDTDSDYQRELRLVAAPEQAYAALTSLSALSAWWATASGDAGAGGELTFTFGPSATAVMRVLETAPGRVVRWGVTDCMLADWIGTTIHFELDHVSKGTLLRFRHEGLSARLACFLDCTSGWDHFVTTSLRNYVETGSGHPLGSQLDRARREARERRRAAASA